MHSNIGTRYGYLVIIEELPQIRKSHKKVKAICDCGKIKIVRLPLLKSGRTKSCGCYSAKLSRERMLKHGLSESKIYSIWHGMKQRCYNIKNEFYLYYGGRGIKVCDRWLHSFESFFEDMGHPPNEKSLDRVNNNGNYEPGNCRWATFPEQMANRSNRHLLTLNGKTKSTTEWAKELGLKSSLLRNRIYRGLPDAQVLSVSRLPARRPK